MLLTKRKAARTDYENISGRKRFLTPFSFAPLFLPEWRMCIEAQAVLCLVSSRRPGISEFESSRLSRTASQSTLPRLCREPGNASNCYNHWLELLHAENGILVLDPPVGQAC